MDIIQLLRHRLCYKEERVKGKRGKEEGGEGREKGTIDLHDKDLSERNIFNYQRIVLWLAVKFNVVSFQFSLIF